MFIKTKEAESKPINESEVCRRRMCSLRRTSKELKIREKYQQMATDEIKRLYDEGKMCEHKTSGQCYHGSYTYRDNLMVCTDCGTIDRESQLKMQRFPDSPDRQ